MICQVANVGLLLPICESAFAWCWEVVVSDGFQNVTL